MKRLEFIFLGVGSVLGDYLRYKITEYPLLFNTISVNILMVNVVGALFCTFNADEQDLSNAVLLIGTTLTRTDLTDANPTDVISIEAVLNCKNHLICVN